MLVEVVDLASNFAGLRGVLETHEEKVVDSLCFHSAAFSSRLRPVSTTLASQHRRFGQELDCLPENLVINRCNLSHKKACFLHGLTNL